ncbi:hypothetical protein [Brevibacterium samyangense]|uniref:Uncharacterized protein n=1 Tax=Brevibacterium samyangense TaxID=366888 RepID=A0ABP5EVV8_9MICO
MARTTITDDTLTITMTGLRRIGTFRNEITVPLAHVRGATWDPGISTRWPGLRQAGTWPGYKRLGTDVPGRYLGGTFVQDGEPVFWDVKDPEKAVVITLTDEEFVRVIVEVDDPESVVREIETALAH